MKTSKEKQKAIPGIPGLEPGEIINYERQPKGLSGFAKWLKGLLESKSKK